MVRVIFDLAILQFLYNSTSTTENYIGFSLLIWSVDFFVLFAIAFASGR